MKLLTRRETDRIYELYKCFDDFDKSDFNKAVNHILLDEKLIKKLLERVSIAKSKLK